MNDIYPNYPAIDLADDKRRISIQVTADNTLEKINRTFEVFKNSKENLIERYDKVIFFMTKVKLKIKKLILKLLITMTFQRI